MRSCVPGDIKAAALNKASSDSVKFMSMMDLANSKIEVTNWNSSVSPAGKINLDWSCYELYFLISLTITAFVYFVPVWQNHQSKHWTQHRNEEKCYLRTLRWVRSDRHIEQCWPWDRSTDWCEWPQLRNFLQKFNQETDYHLFPRNSINFGLGNVSVPDLMRLIWSSCSRFMKPGRSLANSMTCCRTSVSFFAQSIQICVEV